MIIKSQKKYSQLKIFMDQKRRMKKGAIFNVKVKDYYLRIQFKPIYLTGNIYINLINCTFNHNIIF